jgi:hypothetical protein
MTVTERRIGASEPATRWQRMTKAERRAVARQPLLEVISLRAGRPRMRRAETLSC